MTRPLPLIGISLWSAATAASPGGWQLQTQGHVELQNRSFTHQAKAPQDSDEQFSYALSPQLKAVSTDRQTRLTATAFYRHDQRDDCRTHWDIRELKLDRQSGATSLTAGVDRVFWGKAESQNLVDVINTSDSVEGVFTDEKLGQPILRAQYALPDGNLELYYLPYSRKATFSGADGRLRTHPGIDGSKAQYTTSARQWTPGFALRWDTQNGDLETGVSAFHGLSRDPSFIALPEPGALGYAPVYGAISQLGLDAQYAGTATLYKLESIYRWRQLDLHLRERDYLAWTAGLEHTIGAVLQGPGDLGLILEYNRDSLGRASINALQNDLVVGARYSLNDSADTDALFTASLDQTYGSRLYAFKLGRRFGQATRLSLEAFVPKLDAPREFIHGYRADAVITTSLRHYW